MQAGVSEYIRHIKIRSMSYPLDALYPILLNPSFGFLFGDFKEQRISPPNMELCRPQHSLKVNLKT
jgi:hypothetical protein